MSDQRKDKVTATVESSHKQPCNLGSLYLLNLYIDIFSFALYVWNSARILQRPLQIKGECIFKTFRKDIWLIIWQNILGFFL